MAIDLNELNHKVDSLTQQVASLNDTVVKLAEVQVQIAHVLKQNDKQDAAMNAIEDRLRLVEQSAATNQNTLNIGERWAWAAITIGIAVAGLWLGLK